MTKFADSCAQAIWTLMIAKGGATPKEDDYYSSSIKVNIKDTLDAYDNLSRYGIDLSKCSDPASHVAQGFKDTFTNSDLEIHYLAGTLVTNNGKKYEWVMPTDSSDFGKLIRQLISSDLSINDAIERLGDKITDPERCKYPFDGYAYL